MQICSTTAPERWWVLSVAREVRVDLVAGRVEDVSRAAVLIDALAGDHARARVADVGVERVAVVGDLGRPAESLWRAHEGAVDAGPTRITPMAMRWGRW